MTTPVTSSGDFSSLTIHQPKSCGVFQYLSTDSVLEIFKRVVSGEEGGINFAYLARTCSHFYEFCKWSVTPFPLGNEIKFSRAHLNKAIKTGHLEATQKLLQNSNIKIDANEDLTTLLEAIKGGNTEIVQNLLSEDRFKSLKLDERPTNRNALMVALKTSYPNMSYLLWKTGRFPSTISYFTLACRYGHPQVAGEILKNLKLSDSYDIRNGLNIAIANKQLPTAVLLLKSRRVLIDALGPGFKNAATGTAIMVATVVVAIAGKILFFGGVQALTVGIAAAAEAAYTLTLIGVIYLSTILAGSIVLMAVMVCRHLFVLARAVALIAYHHFRQQLAATKV